MSTLVTCPKGHQWEVVPSGGDSTPASPRTTCPVCGASPIPDIPQSEDEDELTSVGTVLTPPVPPPLTVFSGELASTLRAPRPDSLILGLARGSGYELLEPIGRGGMGVVYKARQMNLKRTVALKMLPGDFPDDPTARGRFRTEAESAARLQHPNIVQIYEVGEHEGRPFFSMEYVEGGNLAKKLARGLLPLRQAAEMIECLARAVHYAHERGIAHRDLKPSNVLLTSDGIPKIADFGLAKRIAGGSTASEQNDQTRTGEILGTPSYMAPEQASGQTKEAGASADVYALGAILYELLTGRPPFEGKTSLQALYRVLHEDPIPPLQVQPRVPRDLDTICLACLYKEPGRRYPTAQALADDLKRFLAGEPTRAQPPGRGERLGKWIRRRPTVAVLVGVGVVSALGLLAGALRYGALAGGAVALLGLLAGAWWYSARLRVALREVERQQATAERSVERMHLLLETTQRLLCAPCLEDVLRLLGETTTRLAGAERATIYLVDRERGELWSKVAMGDEVGEIRVPLGRGIAGTVAVTGETINLTDPYQDERFNPEVDRRTGYVTRNMLTLPMIGRDRQVLGVFQVLNKYTGAFDPEDVAILHSLATSAALAVQSAAVSTR
ncbi:MAG: protein kinase [Gemmataceae bacterium]|nr:protein kinase [Gemmataceae bacterium]